MTKAISVQVEEYIKNQLASGASYDDLAGTLFVRPDGITLKLKRARGSKAIKENKFDCTIFYGEKVVILPLEEEG